jgi:hypothetical protein
MGSTAVISVHASNFSHYQIVRGSNGVHKSADSLSVFVSAPICDMLDRYLCPILTRTVRSAGTPSICQARKVIHYTAQPKLLIEMLAIVLAVNKINLSTDTNIWRIVVASRFQNSTFCPQNQFICSVWISETTGIASIYRFNLMDFRKPSQNYGKRLLALSCFSVRPHGITRL